MGRDIYHNGAWYNRDGSPYVVGGATRTVTAGEVLAANDLVYINAAGQALRAQAVEGKEAAGFVSQAAGAGDSVTVTFVGGVLDGLAGLTPGAVYFLSTVAGEFVPAATAAAFAAGTVRMEVGTALSATELLFKPNTPITL